MTKKDFEMIAKTLALAVNRANIVGPRNSTLVSTFADELAKTNPRFDKERFIARVTYLEAELETPYLPSLTVVVRKD